MTAIALSGSTGRIVDQKAIKNDPDNWWSNPATAIGTGPFKMVSYTPKQSVEFDAVANWWGSPKPTLTKVKIDISVTNASTAITKYEQGGYDIVGYGGYNNPPPAGILPLQKTNNKAGHPLLPPQTRRTSGSFNHGHDGPRPAGGAVPP